MSRLCAWTTLLAVLAVSAPAVSRAEESARELFDKGTAAYALGHFDEAAQDYEKAFSLKPDPALLFNAAQAHRQASNKKRALVLYQNYIRLYGNRVSNRAEVERIVASLKKAIDSEQQAASVPPTETATPEPGQGHEPTPPPPAVTTAPPPAATASRPDLTQTPPEKPLIKKPWFWAVVGGSVAAVALGVGLGVGLGTAAHDPKASIGTLKVN
jgi:tetratricopeptide (TPR) repeat protein